jgi:cardiolipin synthase
MTVDGELCTAGSTNFDIRSFRLNFESNAFIYDAEVTSRMDEQFLRDMEHCRLYTQKDRDSITVWEKAAESISRLLTEIL